MRNEMLFIVLERGALQVISLGEKCKCATASCRTCLLDAMLDAKLARTFRRFRCSAIGKRRVHGYYFAWMRRVGCVLCALESVLP